MCFPLPETEVTLLTLVLLPLSSHHPLLSSTSGYEPSRPPALWDLQQRKEMRVYEEEMVLKT